MITSEAASMIPETKYAKREESGVLLALWRALLNTLNDRPKLRWNECSSD